MPQQLQQVACYEINIPVGTNKLSLEQVNLNEKLIRSVYLFSSTEDVLMFSPSGSTQVTPLGETGQYGIFLSLTDVDNQEFIRNFSSGNFTVYSEMDHFLPYSIHRKIDWAKSFLTTIIADDATPFSLLMYVLYGDEEVVNVSAQNTVSKTVELIVNEDIQDFCLNDYFPELTDKRLTGISTAGRCPGYFDLTGNENRLENVPAHFFEIKSFKSFQFAPMKIDLKQSWYRHRSFSHEPFSLTLSFLP